VTFFLLGSPGSRHPRDGEGDGCLLAGFSISRDQTKESSVVLPGLLFLSEMLREPGSSAAESPRSLKDAAGFFLPFRSPSRDLRDSARC